MVPLLGYVFVGKKDELVARLSQHYEEVRPVYVCCVSSHASVFADIHTNV